MTIGVVDEACQVRSWIVTWSLLTAYGSSVTTRGTASTRYASTPRSVVKSARTRSVWYGDPSTRFRAMKRPYHDQLQAGCFEMSSRSVADDDGHRGHRGSPGAGLGMRVSFASAGEHVR